MHRSLNLFVGNGNQCDYYGVRNDWYAIWRQPPHQLVDWKYEIYITKCETDIQKKWDADIMTSIQPALSNAQQVDHGHGVSLTILRVHSTANRQYWASHVNATRSPRECHVKILVLGTYDVRQKKLQFLIDSSKCYDVITRHRHNIAILSVPVTGCALAQPVIGISL